MCIVKRTTYTNPDGRQETKERHLRCHKAPRNGLCEFVDYKREHARTVEVRPSSSRGSPSDGEIITTSRDGRTRRYQTVSRRSNTKASGGRSSRASERSPADSLSPPTSVHPVYREVRPPAPTPPLNSAGYPSARRSDTLSTTLPPDPTVTIGPDGTASYERPPSLEMPRAGLNERQHHRRRSSVSSTTPDLDDLEPSTPSRRRVSFRQRRPSSVVIDVEAASALNRGSGVKVSPGLGNLPNLFADTIPRDKGKSRSRVDSAADEVRRQQQQQEEDERQARLEVDKIAEVERRQRARIRKTEEAAEEARRRAAEIERERADSSQERKERERERRRAAAALEGEQRTRQDAEIERKINAELAQIDREKATADHRRSQQYQPVRPGITDATSARTSYHSSVNPLTSSPIFTRTMSPTSTTTISARGPYTPFGVTVHNYPSARRASNTLSERGAAVIQREQARAASERMNDALARLDMDETFHDDDYDDDDDDDDDLEAPLDANTRHTASRRVRQEARDREREQRRQRDRRLRDSGFY